MKRLINVLLICFFFILTASAQQDDTRGEKGVERLYKILSKNLRYPQKLYDNKSTSLFSVKYLISPENKLEDIIPSKYTPDGMKDKLMDKTLYGGIDWQSFFNRKIRQGDYIILPIALYRENDNSTTIIEYTIDDLFNFSEKRTPIMNGVLLQPFIMKAGETIN
ncbi:hypothetical protein [Chitinophaga polysaccharea]|uniref:hypothetical protein n=1 Tax=Chitinophaga polysaccharea TaxID=1293035 RepID=UPI00115C431C|nr:hypothetical protein [Chitinophaga polysaccharea]